MPQSGSGQSHLGDQGELWFAAALPRGWVWQPPRRDVGKDGLIVIRDKTELHNLEFSVQIKTTVLPRFRDGHLVLPGVSKASIRYWFASPVPTLVVGVDINNHVGWYAWHFDLFDSPETLFKTNAETITIRIPQENHLNTDGWSQLRKEVFDYFKALHRALSTDAVTPHLLQTVYQVSRVIGNLIRLGSSAPPIPPLTQREGMSILIEQMELRDLIHSVRALLAKIGKRSGAHEQIAFWLASFEDLATEAHPSLEMLPPPKRDIPADLQLTFSPKRIVEARPRLILAGVDLIRILTSPRPYAPQSRDVASTPGGQPE
jgi:hypothetical protein